MKHHFAKDLEIIADAEEEYRLEMERAEAWENAPIPELSDEDLDRWAELG